MRMLVKVTLATTLALLLLAVPPSAQAQRTGKMPVVGVLNTFHATPSHLGPLGPELPPNSVVPALRLGLRDLGYVEGHTIALEFRFAEGRPGLWRAGWATTGSTRQPTGNSLRSCLAVRRNGSNCIPDESG